MFEIYNVCTFCTTPTFSICSSNVRTMFSLGYSGWFFLAFPLWIPTVVLADSNVDSLAPSQSLSHTLTLTLLISLTLTNAQ